MDNMSRQPQLPSSRPFWKQSWFIINVVIVVILGGLGWLASEENAKNKAAQHKEMQQAMRTVNQDMKDIFAQAEDASGIPQVINKKIDTTPTATGESGEAERWIREIMQQVVQLQNDYIKELNQLGIDLVLDPQQLTAAGGFERSLNTLRQSRIAAERAHLRHQNIITNMGQRIDTLAISDQAKADMHRGFERKMKEKQKDIDRIWELEVEAVDVMSEMVKVLQNSEGRWQYKGNQYVFSQNSDLALFNKHANRLQAIVAEQTQMRKASQQQAMQSMEKLSQ